MQTFVLKPIGASFYVQHDIFRLALHNCWFKPVCRPRPRTHLTNTPFNNCFMFRRTKIQRTATRICLSWSPSDRPSTAPMISSVSLSTIYKKLILGFVQYVSPTAGTPSYTRISWSLLLRPQVQPLWLFESRLTEPVPGLHPPSTNFSTLYYNPLLGNFTTCSKQLWNETDCWLTVLTKACANTRRLTASMDCLRFITN